MISRPTTDQIIEDCCQELLEHFMPLMPDETMQVRLVMIETVLRNAAVRAAHEIAWMREETEAMTDYARTVQQAHPDDSVTAALASLSEDPTPGLHLSEVVSAYGRVGQLFASALQVASDHDDRPLVAAGRALIDARMARERTVMSNYGVAGR